MRRLFSLWFCGAAAVFLVGILAAWAAYLETDGGQSAPDVPPRRVPPEVIVKPPAEGSEPARALIRGADVGEAVRVEGVTVFFVTSGDVWDSELRTLDDALRAGALRIEEKSEASVSEVSVNNTGRRPVLLVSGELLLGGRQNRIVKRDVLVPAGSGRIAVPVYCVEKERWSEERAAFSSAPAAAEPELRKGAALGREQSMIWDGIDESISRSKADSATRDYRVAQEAPGMKRLTDEVVAGCRRHIPRRTVGMVVALHGRIVGAELFSDPDTFASLWEKLLRGYAMEGGFVSDDRFKHRPRPVTQGEARDFLQAVLEASFDGQSTPGAGRLFSIRGAAAGSALVWQGHAVHIALFAHGEGRPVPQPAPAPFIRRPIEE